MKREHELNNLTTYILDSLSHDVWGTDECTGVFAKVFANVLSDLQNEKKRQTRDIKINKILQEID